MQATRGLYWNSSNPVGLIDSRGDEWIYQNNTRTILSGEETMTRHAFKMKLKPGQVAEYQKRHDEIWPELSSTLMAAGISDYSIFLDEESLTLFAVQKLAVGHSTDLLPGLPIMRRWWLHMADIMEVNPDKSPICVTLTEVFHAP